MTSLDTIKSEIRRLYETNPNIHINVSISRPKIHLTNEAAVIKGVYRNIFRIEQCSSGTPICYTLQYADILTGQVQIPEMSGMY